MRSVCTTFSGLQSSRHMLSFGSTETHQKKATTLTKRTRSRRGIYWYVIQLARGHSRQPFFCTPLKSVYSFAFVKSQERPGSHASPLLYGYKVPTECQTEWTKSIVLPIINCSVGCCLGEANIYTCKSHPETIKGVNCQGALILTPLHEA